MNNKYYVGKNAQNFEQYDDVTISGVILKNDEGTEFSAGDDSGYRLPINCRYATQQMADELFARLSGKVYKGYRATNATLDPMAELGDGVTVDGVYSVLAYRRVNFGPEHMSEIAAPGEGDLNHEYTYVGQRQKELDKFANSITKYIDEIKKQTDEKAETWYQDEDPSTGWNAEQKKEHSGDLWYNTSDSSFYIYNGIDWEKSPTMPPDYVFDRIDKKAEIYVTPPVPPYNVNDLWFGGVDEPIKVCVKSRGEGERFQDSDWEKKDYYINQADAIISVVQQYYSSDSPTSLSGGNWQNTQPTWTQGKYIWSRQYVTFGNGTKKYLPSETGVCITGNTGANGTNGTNGKDGTNGTNGVGIDTIVAEYYVSDSDTQLIDGNWSTNIPTVQNGKYIWFRQKITYTDGNVEYAGQYCMSKTMGDIAQEKVDAQTQEDIFNKLTNNGELEGLYMKDGSLYINASYIQSGTISLEMLKLIGTICGLMQGQGMTGSGETTVGIVMYGNGVDGSGFANPPYQIVTNEGVRIQVSSSQDVYFSNGYAGFEGLNIAATGNINAGGDYAIHDITAIEFDDSKSQMNFGEPDTSYRNPNTYLRGKNVYINEYVSGKYTYIRGYSVQTTGYSVRFECSTLTSNVPLYADSDARLKKDIEPLPDIFEQMLDHLTPVSFRYKTEPDDAPKHWGYTTQDVESALHAAGLSRSDMAALKEREDESGEKYMSLAYEELIPALHKKVKNLEARIKKLEENKNESL